MAASAPPPILILGTPRSYTSVVCAMLGENPGAFGAPELNLFAADTLEELWLQMVNLRQIQLHGLLRTLAHLYSGEQTIAAVDMARRWVIHRLHWSTSRVYKEICRKTSPLRMVDKSPVYVADQKNLERLHRAFPDAHYIHLVRHPRTQGRSIMAIANGAIAVVNNSVDYSTDPPTVDPQLLWHRTQRNIISFLEKIPAERRQFVRGEDLLQNPKPEFGRLCRRLGLPHDSAAIEAMLHPENSPFARFGPIGAHLGNDINFLTSPVFTPRKLPQAKLDGSLPWRTDGLGFRPEVVQLARELGYR